VPDIVVSLTEAMQLTTDRVALENRTVGQVYSQYVIFIGAIGPIFNTNSQNSRTVRNWLVPANIVLATLNAADADTGTIGPDLRQQVVDVVERILNATFTNTDPITTIGERNAVLAAWNASFGTLP